MVGDAADSCFPRKRRKRRRRSGRRSKPARQLRDPHRPARATDPSVFTHDPAILHRLSMVLYTTSPWPAPPQKHHHPTLIIKTGPHPPQRPRHIPDPRPRLPGDPFLLFPPNLPPLPTPSTTTQVLPGGDANHLHRKLGTGENAESDAADHQVGGVVRSRGGAASGVGGGGMGGVEGGL